MHVKPLYGLRSSIVMCGLEVSSELTWPKLDDVDQ